MPISKTPQNELFPLWSDGAVDAKVSRFSALPSAQDIKERMLFGIPLKSALTGQEVSDATIQHYINGAISEVEHSLSLYVTPIRFKDEKHDYKRENFTWNYNYTKLNAPNVLNVEKVELSFNNRTDIPGFIDFPLDFVHVQPQEGVIQLVPAFGTSMSGFMLSAFSGAQFHALNSIGASDFPGGLRITYTAGFDSDKVPAIIVEIIEHLTALKVLSMLGPILFPHNSVSVGIDGVSQSTSNPGPQFLTTRIADIEKNLERLMDGARGYYQRKFIIDYI